MGQFFIYFRLLKQVGKNRTNHNDNVIILLITQISLKERVASETVEVRHNILLLFSGSKINYTYLPILVSEYRSVA